MGRGLLKKSQQHYDAKDETKVEWVVQFAPKEGAGLRDCSASEEQKKEGRP